MSKYSPLVPKLTPQLSFWPHIYMNLVILRCRNCEDENRKIYIKPSFSACVCSTTPNQNALDKAMSGASNARSLDIFEPFLTFLQHWKVENFRKKQVF